MRDYLLITTIIFTLLQSNAVQFKVRRAVGNETTIPKDDLTTEFAKQILRLSKTSDIKSMLNTNVNPCDDFFQYACGNWQRNYPAQLLHNILTDRFQVIGKAFNRRLETLLKQYGSANELDRKVRNFYQACQVAKKDDSLYRLELENVYKEFGELPILASDAWNEDDFVWWQVVAKIQNKYGKRILLAVDIMGDIRNNTENRIYVGPPDFSLDGHTNINLLDKTSTTNDLNHYFNVEYSSARECAKEMIDLERSTIRIRTGDSPSLNLQQLLNLKSVNDLKSDFNESIDIQKYLELVLGTQAPDNIYIYDEKYLESVLKTINGKPKRVVANYILWKLLQEYLIDAAERDLPQWCIENTKKYFGKYLDHMVYESYRNVEAEEDISALWEELRETFRIEFKGDKLDWISNETREYAIEKLNAMTLSINSFDNVNFTELYSEVKIDALNHVENVQHILMLEGKKKWQKLQAPPTALEATKVLHSNTPAYDVLENTIRIPVKLLQPRFLWDESYPQALRYATLGTLIAHEMVHGFDDKGRNYDKNGNQHNWWDDKSAYEFEARRKCLQAQYHNYQYGGQHLPETSIQGENIADNAAVKLAYKAYMRWIQKQELVDTDINQKEMLPNLDLNNRQLFFVSLAQIWCDDVQSLFKSSLAAREDSSPPNMYRVIGSFSNFQEFSWVFQCKPDAPMDPEFKCSIY